MDVTTKAYKKICAVLLLLVAIVFLVYCVFTGDSQLIIAILCVIVSASVVYNQFRKKDSAEKIHEKQEKH